MFQTCKMITVVLSAVLLMVRSVSAISNYTSPSPVQMGRTSTYGVLAYSTITNTGATVINGNLGLYPGSDITGFYPAGIVLGIKQLATPTALLAMGDLGIAYTDASSRFYDQTIAGDIGSLTFSPGVYFTAGGLSISGILLLDAQFRSDACWIFQIGETLTLLPGASVIMINVPSVNITTTAPNVYWRVGSAVTLQDRSQILGVVMAWTAISVDLGSTTGPVFSATAAVNFMANAVTARVVPSTVLTLTPTARPTRRPSLRPSLSPVSVESANNGYDDQNNANSSGFKAGVSIACIVIVLVAAGFIYYHYVNRTTPEEEVSNKHVSVTVPPPALHHEKIKFFEVNQE